RARRGAGVRAGAGALRARRRVGALARRAAGRLALALLRRHPLERLQQRGADAARAAAGATARGGDAGNSAPTGHAVKHAVVLLLSLACARAPAHVDEPAPPPVSTDGSI